MSILPSNLQLAEEVVFKINFKCQFCLYWDEADNVYTPEENWLTRATVGYPCSSAGYTSEISDTQCFPALPRPTTPK